MGVVEQTSTLFAGTVFENIAMGKDGATERDVVEAAIMVCAVDQGCMLLNLTTCRLTHMSSSMVLLTAMRRRLETMAASCLVARGTTDDHRAFCDDCDTECALPLHAC